MIGKRQQIYYPHYSYAVISREKKHFADDKAELLQLNYTQFSSLGIFIVKKLEIEKTKTTFIISVLKVVYLVVLVFWISNFFTNKDF